ncbi:PRADC1-like protein, partial [Pseudolycoriella hygida]
MNDGTSIHELIGNDIFFEIVDPEELEYTYRLRPAKDFGGSFKSDKFKVHRGILVPTIPRDACTKILNSGDIRGNIALIERGECSFLAKTVNVEKVGAIAAFITDTNSNSSESEAYIEMIHDNSSADAKIPAGYILGKNGQMILSTLQRLNQGYAIVNVPVNLTFTPPQLINHPPWLGF